MLKEELVKSASDDDERIIAQSKERNLLITNARLLGRPGLWSIVVDDSIIKRIESTDHFDPIIFPSEDYNVIDAACRIVIPGLVDAHVHLDKCYLLDQCCAKRGDFSEAMSETLLAKKGFSVEDVRNRARRLIEDEISFGTTLMRTHVEVDALVGFKSLEAIMQLKKEYENSITIQIAVFAQEGITNQPGQVDMMKEALKMCKL
jgi:cytosine/creatinine deaminase